jgi:hypothetical protein
MPVFGQSNNPYTAQPFSTYSVGNQYKGQIDANAAVAAPLSGLFFVYQNSPTGMSVLVDDAYNYYYSGGFVEQPSASAASVALTAPTVNPYIACIYWDSITNTFGVTYGAQALSPTPQMPDWITQKPLALVTIPVGASAITSAMIVDHRSGFLLQSKRNFSVTASSGASIDISSCPDAEVFVTVPASGNTLTVTCRYLQKILLALQKPTSGNDNLSFLFQTPSGVTVPAFVAIPAWAQTATAGSSGLGYQGFNMNTTPITVTNGNVNVVVLRSFWNPSAPQLFFS